MSETKYIRPAEKLRPKHLRVRLEGKVHRGLLALRAETGRSMQKMAHEAIVLYLASKNRLDRKVVQEVLDEEKKARRYVRIPVL